MSKGRRKALMLRVSLLLDYYRFSVLDVNWLY